jgi:hypothetical protein
MREELIRKFLLGDLSQEKQEQLEEQLMTDNELYEHLLLLEDELVEQYLDGELTPEEAGQFDSHFLCTHGRQHKLRFARALRDYVRDAPPEPAKDPEPVSRWQAFLTAIQIQRPAWGYALAALLVLNVSGGFWGLMRYSMLKAEYGGVQAEQQAALEQSRALQTRTDELTHDLNRAEAARQDLQQEIADLRAGSASAPNLVTSILTPGFTRSEGSMERIRIPSSETGLVRLVLDMATNEYESYEVRISLEGTEVMRLGGLRAVEDPEKIRLSFLIPGASLERADYEVQLFGTPPRGDDAIVDTYYFRAISP